MSLYNVRCKGASRVMELQAGRRLWVCLLEKERTLVSNGNEFTSNSKAGGAKSSNASMWVRCALWQRGVVQDPVPGSPASDSLGFTRACATAGGCGSGIAVGFPGVPSCNGAPAGDANAAFRPGITFLGSLTPVPNLASTVCTGAPDAAAVDPTITYGATVVYDSSTKTLAAWVTKGSTTGGADMGSPPILQQGSVDLCALLTPGAAPGVAPTGSFYLGFTSTAGDCSANPGSCTAYRALSTGFSSE